MTPDPEFEALIVLLLLDPVPSGAVEVADLLGLGDRFKAPGDVPPPLFLDAARAEAGGAGWLEGPPPLIPPEEPLPVRLAAVPGDVPGTDAPLAVLPTLAAPAVVDIAGPPPAVPPEIAPAAPAVFAAPAALATLETADDPPAAAAGAPIPDIIAAPESAAVAAATPTPIASPPLADRVPPITLLTSFGTVQQITA